MRNPTTFREEVGARTRAGFYFDLLSFRDKVLETIADIEESENGTTAFDTIEDTLIAIEEFTVSVDSIRDSTYNAYRNL
jgi:hypothetical protein